MEEILISIKNEVLSLVYEAESEQSLEAVRIRYLGRNGKLTQVLKKLPTIPIEQRPATGRYANGIKSAIEIAISEKKENLRKTQMYAARVQLDVSNPGIKPLLGHLHLITQAIREITAIFEKIGFTRVRYPEVEWDWYAFTALNFPQNHPARDDWETFFISSDPHDKKGRMILTPHTSSGQVREMEKAALPIRMLNIAKCYRRQSDISHTQMFHQFEGLVIGENISIVHLKGVLDFFVRSYFGEERISRIRPYHFQFTEPSFEVDVSCGVCQGKGCKLCKAGWLELGGAGMVHPSVLRSGGIDTRKNTGFAFGWGVERVLMMKEGIEIDDLRILYSNKFEFLEQF